MIRGVARSLLLLLIVSGIILVSVFMREEEARYGQDKQKTGDAAGHAVPADDLKDKLLTKEQFQDKKNSLEEIPFAPGSLKWCGGEAAADVRTASVLIPCSADGKLKWTQMLEGLSPASPEDSIWFLEDERAADLASAVREGHRFRALLVSGSGAAEFSVVFSGLPVLCLHKTDQEEIVRKEDHTGTLSLIPLYGEGGGAQMLSCRFHVRGNVTSSLRKKPYKISLLDEKGEKLKTGLLDLRVDDDWILNPLYTDKTRIREKTAYDLWEETAAFSREPVPSSRIRFTELFLDDSCCGIYGLMEPVDHKTLSLKEGDLLYKISRWDREYPYIDLYGRSEEERDTVIYNDKGFPCVEIRYPKAWDESATWMPMQTFHEFCFRDQDPERLVSAGLETDMDSVIRISLFSAMTHAEDNGWKNSFLIARSRPGGSYVLSRTIWDLNYTFGDVFVFEPEKGFTAFDPDTAGRYTPDKDSTYDFEAFASVDPDLKKALAEKWALWRSGGISARKICDMAQENADLLEASGAVGREMEIWPQEQDYGEALEDMKSWIRGRFEYLDEYFRYPQ